MSTNRIAALAAAATLCIPAAGCGTPPDRGRMVLYDVTLIDGTGDAARSGMVVAIAGDRIDAVLPVADFTARRTDSIVVASGLYAIPGLWDLHVHLSTATADALPVLIANGVSSVRDMGGVLADLRAWRANVEAGLRIGPRIFMAGPMLEAPVTLERIAGKATSERYWETRIPVPDTVHARLVVDSLAALGVDFIKIREYASGETYRAIVEAASARGLAVAGHAPFSMDPVEGASLGVVSFEHASYPYPLPDVGPKRTAILSAFRTSGVAIVPTLVAWETNVMYPDSLRLLAADSTGTRDPRRRLIAPHLAAEWRKDIEEIGPRATNYYAGYWGFIERMSRDLKAMHDAGIPLLAGSDLSGPGLFPGFALHDELERMVEWIGLTPEDVLVAATRRSAELLGAADSLGTVEVNKLADLVLLEADPLLDIRNTRRIHAVVARGKLIGPARIRELLHGLAPTTKGNIVLSRRLRSSARLENRN
ncbi:MAG TPA: amidohydrolase family protein [Longimicrobiales bacterium]|nr:amidohydrolase family protein [Longimicrobiales bacterium]